MTGTRPRLLLVLPTHTYQADEFIAAAARLDLDLTVGTEVPSSLESFQPDKLTTIDLDDLELARRQGRDFAARYTVHAVFGVNDRAVVVAAAIAEELGIPFLSPKAATLAHDKFEQRKALKAAGVPIPEFTAHRAGDPLPTIDVPFVIKPTCLSASRGVIKVSSPEQTQKTVDRVLSIIAGNIPAARESDGPVYLAESFVEGPEFALEGLVVDGELHTLAIFDKPDPLDGPFFQETIYVTPSRFSEDVQKSLTECASRTVTALGIDRGPVHIELRHNESGSWLIELAARPIGGKCGRVLEFADSRSLEELLMAHAAGIETAVPLLIEGATGVMMIPATEAGVLDKIEGVSTAAAVENVTGVIVAAHPGQTVAPLPDGAVYLGFIFARAARAEAVERALRQAFACLEIKLR